MGEKQQPIQLEFANGINISTSPSGRNHPLQEASKITNIVGKGDEVIALIVQDSSVTLTADNTDVLPASPLMQRSRQTKLGNVYR